MLLVGLGLVLVLDPTLLIHQVHLGSVPSWNELIFALSLAMLAYTGIETVANMAEESKDPGRQVPEGRQPRRARRARRLRRHLRGGPLGAAGHPPRRRLQPRAAQYFTPPGYATALGGLLPERPRARRSSRAWACTARSCRLAEYYVGLLAATILFIATNAGMIGISRLSWSLAEHRQLPRIFSQLHPKLPHAVVHADLLLGARRRC